MPRRTRAGSRKATTGRSPKPPTTTAPWRCRCSSTGCRAAGTELRRLEIEIGPDRHVVRRFFPGAHIAVDADIDQPVAGLRRQQQMVDPQAPVLLPGPGLVVPEGVLAGLVGHRSQGIGQPEAQERLEGLSGGRAE